MESSVYKSLDFCGFPNYLVTTNGNIFNATTGVKLNSFPTGDGKYDRVCLYNEQGCKYFCIHQLVAMAFVPNPNNYNTVDHINFDTHCNSVENLQWLDIKENSRRSWLCGNHDSQKKKVKQLLHI